MSARANWFVEQAQAADDPDDPWALPIEEIGERIDLRDPRAALELRLRELLLREGHLFERGVTCAIKEKPDTCCHACPVSKAHDPAEALAALCRVGREQERTCTELAVLMWQDR
jgi:hypothetical protein